MGKYLVGQIFSRTFVIRKRKPRGRNRRGKDNPTLQVTLIVNKMLTVKKIFGGLGIWDYLCTIIHKQNNHGNI